MQSYVEQSASNDTHWHERTFFDLQDPEMVPGPHGQIQWTVRNFNGTKETPQKDLLLTSHVVEIGGFEWRIKLLPHGNMHTDRLSLYVENVSVQSMAPEEWPEDKLSLPLVGSVKVMKRRAVAAQISILVYNPSEPRVNEFRADAHQFHQGSPDHGWTRFTSVPWYEINRRSYAQRQPLLRNDTLAIKAFIRVINDPTGCLWATKESRKLWEVKSAMTGLMPLFTCSEDHAIGPVLALWLHLRPFREIIYKLGSHDLLSGNEDDDDSESILPVLQAMLWRLRSRRIPDSDSRNVLLIAEYLEDVYDEKESQDIMQTMDGIITEMNVRLEKLSSKDAARAALAQLRKTFGDLEIQFSGKRQTKLSIEGKTSMQEVIDDVSPQSLPQSEILTIELDRQTFDTKKRCWKKLLNKVRLDDQITVGGTRYTLYGFAAHEGHLRNGRYSSHFRPGGIGGLWYTYKHLFPICQTTKQAVTSKEGVSPPEAVEEPVPTSDRPTNYDRLLGQVDAVAYVVIYVRNGSDALDLAVQEPWDVPQWITDDFDPKPASPAQGTHSAPGALSYDDHSAQNEDAEMNDITDGSISMQDEVTNSEPTKVTINYLSQPFYSGTMQDNDYHGHGHHISLAGDEYTGSFARGLRSGEGTMTYSNGDTYVGSWSNDEPHGQGTCTEARTGNVYQGNWLEGKKHGQGTTFWKCSEEESKMCRICYCEQANAAFYDCGHVVACIGCARRVEDCPVCRRRVRDVIKLYYMA